MFTSEVTKLNELLYVCVCVFFFYHAPDCDNSFTLLKTFKQNLIRIIRRSLYNIP